MLKRLIFLVGFLTTFSLFTAQNSDVKSETTEISKVANENTENQDYIQHHLLDAHSFDLMTTKSGKHIGFSLPVIFYDKENGFHFMMSSAFHHGENVVESKGAFYKLFHEKIYKTDASGTINLNEQHHATNEKVLDFSITKSVLMIIITALLMIWIFVSIAKSYKKSLIPTGAGKIFEPIIIFVKDEIAKPNIGAKYHKYMGFLLTVFFFVLFLNIFGLMPFGINVTGNIAITAALAILTFIITQFTANGNYWKHIFWMPGLPLPMKIIMIPIELIGLMIKPFALLIRLFANMTAGHIVIMTLISLVYVYKNWIAGSLFPLLTLMLYLIEILVAFLQAYIFTMLSAVYFGMANEEAHHEH
ncbi:MAG: F0F1 ATP synthase subunit A [Flavobacteriaceae bacterium]|jgi:F-type H+-transporting ATPase subunit a|nr:F0F1 ATP synthase subunit A [Flavobacteriaceae bacterium]